LSFHAHPCLNELTELLGISCCKRINAPPFGARSLLAPGGIIMPPQLSDPSRRYCSCHSNTCALWAKVVQFCTGKDNQLIENQFTAVLFSAPFMLKVNRIRSTTGTTADADSPVMRQRLCSCVRYLQQMSVDKKHCHLGLVLTCLLKQIVNVIVLVLADVCNASFGCL